MRLPVSGRTISLDRPPHDWKDTTMSQEDIDRIEASIKACQAAQRAAIYAAFTTYRAARR